VARRKKQSGGGLVSLVIGVLVLWFILNSASSGNSLAALIVLAGIALAVIWLVRRASLVETSTVIR
jgi:uncharacterized membrane protein YccC